MFLTKKLGSLAVFGVKFARVLVMYMFIINKSKENTRSDDALVGIILKYFFAINLKIGNPMLMAFQ
jgi:hypothetical protein